MKDLQVLDDKSNNEISINEIEEEEKGEFYVDTGLQECYECTNLNFLTKKLERLLKISL